jgi:hypothetical protein
MPDENHLPPLPWRYEARPPGAGGGGGFVYLIDANGRKIASVWGRTEEKIAIARLIAGASEAEFKRRQG